MKFKFRLLLLCGFVAIGLLVNSCKKSNQDYIATLFTGGKWQLSSVTVTNFTGATRNSVDTLYASCSLTQAFTFNIDKTCTYTNFDCDSQKTTGHWSLSSDKLFLNSDLVCQTSAKKDTTPFTIARIVNLGQYSLILQTGDLETYYSPTQIRNVTQWGFVRVKSQ
jgi:hypothetical protein